ncbi:MAG TPA: SpoIIE family protein phosphatase [Blastocatellia bacterium]|nr:SpoIIE family protein phosphatase [Blastocatellia bacterium]
MNDAVPRALIADDQSDVLVALQLLLKSEGFKIEAATSPAAVLEKVAANKYDVLLMDMNYARDTTSGREGLDLLTRVKALDQALPVIAMTAWGSIELAVEAMQRGLSDFIQKPWNNARLLQVLREQLAAGRRKRAARNELVEARAIQQRLIPRASLQVGHYDFACLWQPAGEVSGDYCDIALLEHQVALCIGDVSGKGLPAALLMANLQAAVKTNEEAKLTPSQLVKNVNRVISQNVSENKFITFFYGVVDTRTNRLTYTNAGHNAPLLVRRDGSVFCLSTGGVILGILPEYPYAQGSIELQPGDQLLLYTDGISEATNAEGEEFGEARLQQFLRTLGSHSAFFTLQQIHQVVSDFHQMPERDDRTMIAMTLAC